MAKILGEAGRFCIDEAASLHWRRLRIAMAMVGLICFVEGASLSGFWAGLNPPTWLTNVVQYGGLIAIGLMIYWGFRKMKKIEVRAANWKRGAQGESVVGTILTTFPDAFHVIHDVATPHGNLDHVVIGPTGVFVLETKNWRGIVRSDGNGELLQNGEATHQPHIRRFLARMMATKEKVDARVPRAGAYFQGVFVFTAARVEAAWGTTGRVNCIREDQLWRYIVEKDFGQPLTEKRIELIAQAFHQLTSGNGASNAKANAVLESEPVAMRAVLPAKA